MSVNDKSSEVSVAGCSRQGEIIELPANDLRRLKVLHAEITKRLSGKIDQYSCKMSRLIYLENLGRQLKIDDSAFIDTFPGDEDMYFVLETHEGTKLPLVTKDIPMMADFICMYILARIDHFVDILFGAPANSLQ